jgi:hypothetical protein
MEWYVTALITDPNEAGFPPDTRQVALDPAPKLPGVPNNKVRPTWNRKKRRPIDWSRVPHREDAKRPNAAGQDDGFPQGASR